MKEPQISQILSSSSISLNYSLISRPALDTGRDELGLEGSWGSVLKAGVKGLSRIASDCMLLYLCDERV